MKRGGVNKKIKQVFDERYYRVQALLKNPRFIKRIAWLITRFAKFGCPIPEGGFKNYDEYIAWNGGLIKRYYELKKSPEFIARLKKITWGRDTWGAKEQRGVER